MDETILEYGVFITPDLKELKPHGMKNQLVENVTQSQGAFQASSKKRGLLAMACAMKKNE